MPRNMLSALKLGLNPETLQPVNVFVRRLAVETMCISDLPLTTAQDPLRQE